MATSRSTPTTNHINSNDNSRSLSTSFTINNANVNNNTGSISISQLKFNASKLNQQLLSSIMSTTTTTTTTSDSISSPSTQSTSFTTHPSSFEFMKMISQFEQYCDELITIQNDFKEQQVAFKEQQLESKAQQQQQQLQLQLKEQQLELREQQFEIKQQHAEFQLQQKHQQAEFQLQQKQHHKQQQQQQPQQQHEQFYNIDEFVSLPLSTISSSSSSLSQLPTTTTSKINTALIEIPLQQEQQQQHEHEQQQSITTSLTTSKVQDETNINETTPIICNELLQHVIEDYQSMKYLVEQSTTTQQLFQQHYATLNEKMKDVDDIKQIQSKVNTIEMKVNKIDQIESQLQQSLHDQSTKFDQRLILFEQTHQQQLTAKMIENQRKQVPLILKQNRDLMKDKDLSQFIIFQIENCPDIQHSCSLWAYDHTIYDAFYNYLIQYVHPTKLKPLLSTIKASKLYISSQSVLNGEWIQIQGDGAIVGIEDEDKEEEKVLQIGDFLKPGDDIYQYDDYQCKKCELGHYDTEDTTTNRYLIKFKWE